MNSTDTNAGGYATSELAPKLETLYKNLADSDLKATIKEVIITCNDGYENQTVTHEYRSHMFLASVKEVGFDVSGWSNEKGCMAEGTCFDLFTTSMASRTGFMNTANISHAWWLRSATSQSDFFYRINAYGDYQTNSAENTYGVVPVFVIG